jgi:transcriptional regulator with XRE-family HTH domain
MTIVNGKVLAEARGKKGWTQVELSEATRPKIDVSTISRIERGKPTRVRANTLKALAKALDVGPESLCVAPEGEREVMKIRIETAARNALTLVALRYGIRRERIVEIAPLLFFIAAEQCLQELNRRIREIRDANEALRQLYHGISLEPLLPPDSAAVDCVEQSIEARDLFGQKVIEDGFVDRFTPDYNPLVTFLRDNLARLSSSPEAAKSVRWTLHQSPRYEICHEEAGSIVGGDARAAWAIVCGAAALHDMPKGSPEQRAEWAQAEFDEFKRDLDDFMSRFRGQTSDNAAAS